MIPDLKPLVPRSFPGTVSKPNSDKVKYVNDGTVAVSIDLKTCLIPDPVNRARPRNYHERTGHVLPEQNNLLQFYIRDAEQFVSENLMVLNKQKTKVMSFTKSRKWDFPPEVCFSDRTPLECIPDTRLVGVVISQDLKWFKNTAYICEKARGKLWILRRMLKVNLDGYQLFDVYTKEIISIFKWQCLCGILA